MLAIVLAVCAALVGGFAGTVIGARFFEAPDDVSRMTNAITGMTVGCGIFVAAATYLSTRLSIRSMQRATLVALFAGIGLVMALFVWSRTYQRGFRESSPEPLLVEVKAQQTIREPVIDISMFI